MASPKRGPVQFLGHAAFIACWTVVVVMALVTWLPHVTPFKTDIIVGSSMEPNIPLYSVIAVEPVKPADLRVGDVITFEEPDMPGRKVTHRIKRIEQGKDQGTLSITTKGDNNDVQDPWRVTYADEAWRVRAHLPHVGWLLIQAQSKLARILLVGLPIILITGGFLRSVWKEPDAAPADPWEAAGLVWDPDGFDHWDDDQREAAA